jgi:hypothetical protein
MNSLSSQTIPKWRCWETVFDTARVYSNPLQEVSLQVTLESPGGRRYRADGFWDGGSIWRVRFCPDELGAWRFVTICSDPTNTGLHGQQGTFFCTVVRQQTRFDRHGPVRVSKNRRHLVHADGAPFLWLADTAWNGPLWATLEEWSHYLRVRTEQKFTAVQWATTQWIAAPAGDLYREQAYQGLEQIEVNPAFFQRLDAKIEAINEAGLLAAPVLLWAASWCQPDTINLVNPGFSLPQDQAILLSRYLVARWGGYHILWILNGDGDYQAEKAAHWQTIGRALFGERPHAPVSLHPCGQQWVHEEFAAEDWLDMVGYQSGHRLDDQSLSWLVAGPPATDWVKEPIRPFINLEPCYEDHHDMSGNGLKRIDAHAVRRALYTSLLIAPTAGVTYGGHGVWGWDKGDQPPIAHAKTGVPRPWPEALRLPAAEQVRFLADLFNQIEWWRLRPAPEMILEQPGREQAGRWVVAAQTESGDLAVVYTPKDPLILTLVSLRAGLSAYWVNPRSGDRLTATFQGDRQRVVFETPSLGDWLLLFN